MLIGGEEWNRAVPVSYFEHEVLKIDDLIFFTCPVSWITSKSWEVMDLVNESTDPETGRILHLPYPGALTEQPAWYREAVKIKRKELCSKWYAEELKRMKKRQQSN